MPKKQQAIMSDGPAEREDGRRSPESRDPFSPATPVDDTASSPAASLEVVVATLTRAVEALAVGQRAAQEKEEAAAATTAAGPAVNYAAMRAYVAERLATGALGVRDATEARFLGILGCMEDALNEADLGFYRERLRTLAVALRYGWRMAVVNSPRFGGEPGADWGLNLVIPQPSRPADHPQLPAPPPRATSGRGAPARRRPIRSGRGTSRAFARGRTVEGGSKEASSA